MNLRRLTELLEWLKVSIKHGIERDKNEAISQLGMLNICKGCNGSTIILVQLPSPFNDEEVCLECWEQYLIDSDEDE